MSTNFIDGQTVITAAWLNAADAHITYNNTWVEVWSGSSTLVNAEDFSCGNISGQYLLQDEYDSSTLLAHIPDNFVEITSIVIGASAGAVLFKTAQSDTNDKISIYLTTQNVTTGTAVITPYTISKIYRLT